MSTAEPVIDYDSVKDVFSFPVRNTTGFPRQFRFARNGVNGGYIAMFTGKYPASLSGLRTYKAAYPHGKATVQAMEKIREVGSTREALIDCTPLNSMEDMFPIAPYEHQRDAINHMIHYQRLALLLEQGLGKTYISIMALKAFRRLGIPHKALIICPNIVLQNWVLELQKFSDFKVQLYYGNPDIRGRQREAIRTEEWDVVLTTFDMLIDRAKAGKSTASLTTAQARQLWSDFDSVKRKQLADKWLSLQIISQDAYTTLVTEKGTAKWLVDCANIVKRIHPGFLPTMAKLHAVEEQSNKKFLTSISFDCMVVDEASRCIDHASSRSTVVEMLARKIKRCYLLSGTLCVGRPTDMFQPMNILDPAILGESNWYSFQKTYCIPSKKNKHVIVGYRHLDKLKNMVDPYILAKTRSECIDLPERIFTQRFYTLPTKVNQLYNSIITAKEAITVDGHEIRLASPLVKLTKCMQVLSGFLYYETGRDEACSTCENIIRCTENGIVPGSKRCDKDVSILVSRDVLLLGNNPKLDLLAEDLKDNSTEKTIIWAWYRHDLEVIEQFLKENNIKYVTASTPGCAEKFENNKDILVFLGQTVQGIGITLNSATTTIYYSHGFALEPRLQSMDRNYRIGQNKTVIVKDYICKDSLEWGVVSLLRHKEDVKDFMQANTSCTLCDRLPDCLANGIRQMRDGCIHSEAMRIASTRKKLTLSTVVSNNGEY